ncbi:MAG: hypothetical protein C4574_00615 [Candidatus Latescibacterota bacterium]|jgi:predicted phage terminase large subunit-like protein|nr:MAG: hypothetical protein C4574_00615 [Candidatus Latescibacterota bacterium]
MPVTRAIVKKELEEIIQILGEDVQPLPPEEKPERVAKSKTDMFEFMKLYLPHYADSESAPFHRELVEEMERRTETAVPIVRAAPRGFAKSTVVSFAYVLWSICFKKRHFIVVVSANDDLASDLVNFVLVEFRHNRRIEQDFGKLVSEAEKNDFRANGVRVFSRSWHQGIRGFRERNHRPDLIILDDLEKDKETQSPRIVAELLEIIKEGIYPSLRNSYATLIWIGTVMRRKSALAIALYSDEEKEPYRNWNRKVYRAVMKNNKGEDVSLWPSYWPLAKLEAIRETIGSRAFEKEYQNNPLDEDDAVFREEWIRYYHPDEIDPRKMRVAMWVDPSARNQAHNDYKALVAIAVDLETLKRYVVDVWIKKGSIDQLLRATYRMHRSLIYRGFHMTRIGVEANGFQSLLEDVYDHLAKEMGEILPLKLVDNLNAKTDRIESLSPWIERGKMLFARDNGDDSPLLIEQILFFPKAEHDDGPDALAGANSLLDTGNVKPHFTQGKCRESRKMLRGYDGPEHADFDTKKGRF